jgi:hypothetical protein
MSGSIVAPRVAPGVFVLGNEELALVVSSGLNTSQILLAIIRLSNRILYKEKALITSNRRRRILRVSESCEQVWNAVASQQFQI